ncbi:aldehyde dehydrogenase family protein [Psychromarinibacter sp. C21-152]|uniref:Aldehyde dehydrogenase family protein n=1 Tax=Psychromarinibacter sediminicola TaxID=3033385 RepID=A0AAE3NSS5_9RHOB|nr:aldehyde dehydrogenase family protein [Psychromarinibacter sediminicola]MDF0600974.1 aldehyde dehydrogenase family protein [Psychromarinibacter sediminicola]
MQLSDIPRPAGHFIAGRHVPGDETIEVVSPSTGRPVGAIPVADAGIVDEAVAAARAALASSGWGGVAPRDRLRALHAWADLIEQEAETLALIEAVCSSRPAAQARSGDVPVTAEQIRFFAEFADKEGGALVPTSDAQHGFISDEPYGVVGAITPWNFPINMAGWKLGPALAAGNAVVLKPSEMTPWSTLYLAELSVRAGLTAGLVNVVLGDGPVTGTAITGHAGIDKVSFTGSTRAGAAIMENVARTGIKPMTLELGGKSPMVVFADADLDLAAACLDRGIMPNAGQFCVAGSRILVEESIAEELAARLAERFARYRPVDTLAEADGFSPIISGKQMARIDGIVRASAGQGAEVLCGGEAFDREGNYYRPTLLTGVTQDNPAVTEEIFGPVATFQTFATEDEAMALAAHATYGLAAGLFTRDLSRALRLSRRIEAGTVWINRYGRSRDHILPTGGWKASGLGKDLGREAYHASRRTKSVLIDL